MKITPILYSRPLSNGEYQIKVRIHSKGKTSYINTGHSIPKDKWDNSRRKVKEHKSFPEHIEINNKINRLVRHLKGESLTNEVGDQYSYDKFMENFEKDIRLKVSQEKYNTYRKHKVVKNHIARFKEQNPTYDIINLEFLKEFRIYLFDEVKLKQNGVHSYFKVFRTQLNNVIKDSPDSFNPGLNPFNQFKVTLNKVNKPKLSVKQLSKLIDTDIPPDNHLFHVRNYFLFAFYSGGMRISDLLTLRWKSLKEQRLRYEMRKTGTRISLPLNQQQISILLNYLPKGELKSIIDELKVKETILTSAFQNHSKNWKGNNTTFTNLKNKAEKDSNNLASIPKEIIELIDLMSLKKGEEFVFPLLDINKTKSKTDFLRQISSKTTIINKQLKELSRVCDLGEQLTFHIARHTLSDMMRVKEVGLYDISKILGHSDIAVTQKYLNSIDQESMDESANTFYGSL